MGVPHPGDQTQFVHKFLEWQTVRLDHRAYRANFAMILGLRVQGNLVCTGTQLYKVVKENRKKQIEQTIVKIGIVWSMRAKDTEVRKGEGVGGE